MPIDTRNSRPFRPGTTGWTEDDLYDPRIEQLWERGRYEIVQGVLTKLPAVDVQAALSLNRLVDQVRRHFEEHSIQGDFGSGVDVVVSPVRVSHADVIFLTPEQLERQAAAPANPRQSHNIRYGRLRVAPELVIESISPGHELHALCFNWPKSGFR